MQKVFKHGTEKKNINRKKNAEKNKTNKEHFN